MANNWQRWKGIQKCVPFEEKRLAKWKPPYIVQPKLDGVRCRAIPIQTGMKGNEYILLSSEENLIRSVPHINEELSNLKLRAELDGELYIHNASFEEIVSITSRTVNLHPDYRRMQFHIFDIVNDQMQMRRQLLVESLRGLSHWLPIAPFWLCESLEDVMRAYDKLIELGYEGIIVRHTQAPYEKKRSTWVMKFKPKKEDIYEIISVTEELSIEGTPKGSLGALVCASGDGGTFSVGTGFKEDERRALWLIRDQLPGRIARVKYQHLTAGKKVPRFPVFVEVIENDENSS